MLVDILATTMSTDVGDHAGFGDGFGIPTSLYKSNIPEQWKSHLFEGNTLGNQMINFPFILDDLNRLSFVHVA